MTPALDERGRSVRLVVRGEAAAGRLVGRGPDSEPLVAEVHPLAWLSAVVIAEAETDVTRKHDGWGTLRRATPPAVHEGS
ncbi:DUF6098 family protein [Actinacidiphila glaucinigra]|uniref:DUF6098 family protein n=1 Tax=Actinacidiphila glaucinigra TaxID=235986 RepID=UPI003D8BEF8A